MNTIFREFVARLAGIDDRTIIHLDKCLTDMGNPEAHVKGEAIVIADWKDLHARLNTFSEKELREIINYEVAMYHRKAIIERLHMRYCKLRSKREREMMMMGIPAL